MDTNSDAKAAAYVVGPALARILDNALNFSPARGLFPVIRLQARDGRLVATGSDAYVLGQDECPAETTGEAEVFLPRKDVSEIAKIARGCKKDRALIEWLGLDEHGAHFRITPHEGEPTLFLCPVPSAKERLLFQKSDNLLEQINEQKPTIGLAPEWFAPFGKVKQDAEVLLFCPGEHPEDVIGFRSHKGTFRGAYMPINVEEWT